MGAALTLTAKLEYCEFDRSCSPKNTKAFGQITMMLMYKSANGKREITAQPSHKWSDTAVDFLASTRTWIPDKLLKVGFPGL
jgi:hypothetical protein